MIQLRHIVALMLVMISVAQSSAADKETRFKIKTVIIAGNHAYTDKRLHRVIVSKPSVLFGAVYYYPEVLKDDIDGIVLFYKHNGYLNASVEDYKVTLDSVKHRADIRIRIDEGELTRVDGITIFDNEVFSDSILMPLIPLKAGGALRNESIGEGTLAMLTYYADHGYLDATVTPEIRLDSIAHLASIDYFIKENAQFHIDSTIFKGLTKTRPSVVMREIEFKNGEVFNYSKLLKTQRNLYLTGLFQSAFVRPVAPVSGHKEMKDVLIEMKENKSREYNFSIGYGTVERGRLGIGLYNNNWRGSAQKIGIAIKLSFIEAGVEASFSEPWTFNTRWRTDLGASINYLKDQSYDQKTTGVRISVGRLLINHISTNLTYRHQNVELSRIKIVALPDDIRVNIRSLKLTFTHDTRDNLFNPTQGKYLEQSTETAGLFQSASESFTRIRVLARFVKTVTTGTVVASGLELGWMGSPRGFNSIIFSERLYAGGPSSIRGFKYKHAGPLDANGYPIGGGFLAVLNLAEVRQSIYKIVGGVVFLDLGNVWPSIREATIREVRVSPGIGLRLDTALGLFRIDYGMNIDPQGSEPPSMFYFSVGQAF